MMNLNLKRSAMLLGAAAIMLSASAADTYRDVTSQYMVNTSFVPGWQGGLTDVVNGVGEAYNGAFNLYQVLPDMAAGEYTLTANALYRCGNNAFSMENMKDGKNHYAYLYLGSAEVEVKGLFDDGRVVAPNSTGESHDAFEAGDYLNTVTFNHPGGDLVLGIKNLGGYSDEWCCFSNFKLTSATEDLTSLIKNANFTEGFVFESEDGWNMTSSENKVKTPDTNRGGGVYRKTNASPYNFGQQVELPAGTYRFSALTLFRYGGAGNYDGQIISCKNAWGLISSDPSPKQWYDQNLYTEDNYADNAYLYMSTESSKPSNLGGYKQLGAKIEMTRIKGPWEICEGDYAVMPENETRGTADFQEIVPAYDVRNVVAGWCDSGSERESAAAFVNEPEKWRQYVEFTLTDTTKVWLGLGKDQNQPAQYWNAFVDFKLEVLTSGDDTAVESAMVDEDAAPVYYNLQGVRVANPSNGIFIVKKGNKTTKQVIK